MRNSNESANCTKGLHEIPTSMVKTVRTIPTLPPLPITMLIFHGLRNQDLFINCSHVSTLSWGKGALKTHIAHIMMEECTINSPLFAQNLTSVPKSFDTDCLKLSFIKQNWKPYHICSQNSEQFVKLH